MSSVRPLNPNKITFMVPAELPKWCRDMQMSDAGFRDLAQPGEVYIVGPAGQEWFAKFRCEGPGRAIGVQIRNGRTALFPTWAQAAGFVVAAVREHGAAPRGRRRLG